jgi:hypothetical protein
MNLAVGAGAVSLAALIATSSVVRADEAPSNQELYNMLQVLQAQQQQLVDEMQRARTEAANAKEELAATKAELERARSQITANTPEVGRAREDTAAAKTGLDETVTEGITIAGSPGGQTVMGSGPFPGAVMEAQQPAGAFASFRVKYLKGGDAGQDFAVANTTPSSATSATGNDGPVQSIGDDWAPAWGGELGWNFGNGTDARVSLDYYSEDMSETIVSAGNAIQVTQGHPDRIGNDYLEDAGDFATASLDRKLIYGGPEIGKRLSVGSDLALRVSTGLQVFDFDNTLTALYVRPIDIASFQTIQDNDVMAFGGRLGLGADWRMTPELSFGLSLGAALHYAQRDYKIDQRNSGTSLTPDDRDNFLNFSVDESFLMPALDLKASLTYSTDLGGLPSSLTFGYDFQTWIDAIKDVRATDDVAEHSFVPDSRDMMLHGPFLRATVAIGQN